MRTMDDTIRASMLARAFGAILTGWLDARQMALANERNALDGLDCAVCHSHDFCDANVAMIEAFALLMGREQITEDENIERAQLDIDLMNDAWTLAKSRRFWGDRQEADFWKWRETMEACGDLGSRFSDESLSGTSGLLYDCGYIENLAEDVVEAWERSGPRAGTPPTYRLLIERSEWYSSDLEALERILFFEWVLPNSDLADARDEDLAPGVAR